MNRTISKGRSDERPATSRNQDVCFDFVGYEIIPFCISAGCMDCQITEDFAQTEVEQTA